MEEIMIEVELEEFDITEMIKSFKYNDRTEIGCEAACEYVYNRDRGWIFEGASSCDLQIDDQAGSGPEIKVGSLHCTAQGIEYYCQ